MPSPYAEASTKLLAACSAISQSEGERLCEEADLGTKPLVKWLEYLEQSEDTGVAQCLLSGVRAVLYEAIGCISLGLIRPAIFSIRTQADLILSWLFFKDHAVEWDRLEMTGDGFKLKADALVYLGNHYLNFNERFAMLRIQSKWPGIDLYRILSAHVHCQSSIVVPKVAKLADIVRPVETCDECIGLQLACAEYICDVLLSCYSSKWTALPPEVAAFGVDRLTPAQRAAFFS